MKIRDTSPKFITDQDVRQMLRRKHAQDPSAVGLVAAAVLCFAGAGLIAIAWGLL